MIPHRPVLPLLLLSSLLLAAPAAAAPNLVLDRAAEQGGLVLGHAVAGARITLDGEPVDVGPGGNFALGFGRDAQRTAVLEIRWPDGRTERRGIHVRKRKWRIQRIEGLPPRLVTPTAKDLKRIRADSEALYEARARHARQPFFRHGFAWPVLGRISGVYGSQRILNGKPRNAHLGVDIAAPRGTPVHAAADGIIVLAHPNMFFTGETVLIDHGLGVGTSYSHLSAITVKPGQRVKKGQMIGRIGATGRATGPHLHWGLTWNTLHLDAATVVGPMPKVEAKP